MAQWNLELHDFKTGFTGKGFQLLSGIPTHERTFGDVREAIVGFWHPLPVPSIRFEH